MLRPLLCLSVLIALAGAQQTFTNSSEVNISSCPITYYGQKYERLYVTITSGNVTVCFTGFFSPETGGDCIVERSHGANSFYFLTYKGNAGFDAAIQSNLPTIKNSVDCFVRLTFYNSDFQNRHLLLNNFGTQAALILATNTPGSLMYELQVGGTTVDSVNVTVLTQFYFLDISGCRHSGVVYKSGTVISSDPKTCSNITCSETAVLQTSGCGPLERCQVNSICMLDTTICTVTGPTVIDIHSQVNSISDRCAYSLVSTPSVPDFLVLANFQERRRKDVSFLDSVTLRVDGVHIHLEQGGRVQLNYSTLTLNSSAQLVHGVELSKDQTGVTAKLSLSNLTTSIFFDGYTAQIHFTGPAVSSLEGLCGNSSRSLSELRLSEYSSTSCEIQYNDTADSTINCNKVTERCNLLKEAPFTSCNNDTDPKPYITACTDTLCKYPAVDGLNCQFLKAYARACSVQGNHTLEGWRSKTGCSPEAFYQDRTCSHHEFCGEKTVGGDTRCFCRAIYASKYRSTDSLGDPTVCNKNSASLTLVGCLLEDKGIDYSNLHLNNQTCRGQMDKLTHMVTFSFNGSNSCGTLITTNNSQIIYKNAITTSNISDLITRQNQVYIDFSCIYTQPDTKTETFSIRDNSVIKHITSGAWNYTLTMKSFTDVGRTQAVESSTELQLNQKIWVELKTDGLDGDIVVVVTDSCWATHQPSPISSPRYDLIKDGCANPADRTVKVEENGLRTSNYFSFNMFQFTGSSGEVYLHCKVHLCPTQENSCSPDCNPAVRRRRSARATYEGEALISMAWTH